MELSCYRLFQHCCPTGSPNRDMPYPSRMRRVARTETLPSSPAVLEELQLVALIPAGKAQRLDAGREAELLLSLENLSGRDAG